jgi:hypothetical protein
MEKSNKQTQKVNQVLAIKKKVLNSSRMNPLRNTIDRFIQMLTVKNLSQLNVLIIRSRKWFILITVRSAILMWNQYTKISNEEITCLIKWNMSQEWIVNFGNFAHIVIVNSNKAFLCIAGIATELFHLCWKLIL